MRARFVLVTFVAPALMLAGTVIMSLGQTVASIIAGFGVAVLGGVIGDRVSVK